MHRKRNRGHLSRLIQATAIARRPPNKTACTIGPIHPRKLGLCANCMPAQSKCDPATIPMPPINDVPIREPNLALSPF